MAYKVFLLLTVYYLLCGLSAIFLPSAWTIVTGVNLEGCPLALELIGVLFLSLGVGAFIAARAPERNIGIAYVLLSANLLDLILVVKAIVLGQLPQLQGAVLFGIDAFWCFLLIATLRRIRA